MGRLGCETTRKNPYICCNTVTHPQIYSAVPSSRLHILFPRTRLSCELANDNFYAQYLHNTVVRTQQRLGKVRNDISSASRMRANTQGLGTGPDSESMCQFSCKYGYCPLYDCEITATGPLVPPPDPTMPLSSFATNLLPPGKNLCAFACARGVCNTGYCYPQPTHTPTPTETAKPTTTDWTTLDPSQVIVVYSDTNCQNPIAGYGCQEIRNS